MKADFTPGHHFRLEKAAPWISPALAGAGGIRSTANDLLIFLAASMDIIHTPLQPAMKKMLSVQREASPGIRDCSRLAHRNGSRRDRLAQRTDQRLLQLYRAMTRIAKSGWSRSPTPGIALTISSGASSAIR